METISLYLILSTVVQKIVEWARSRFETLHGDVVRLIAVATGTVVAWSAGIQVEDVFADLGVIVNDVPAWLSYLGSGAAIGFGAGAVSDLLNRSGGGDDAPVIEYTGAD